MSKKRMTKKTKWLLIVDYCATRTNKSARELAEGVRKDLKIDIKHVGLLKGLNKRGIFLQSQEQMKEVKKPVINSVSRKSKPLDEGKKIIKNTKYYTLNNNGARKWKAKAVLSAWLSSGMTPTQFCLYTKQKPDLLDATITKNILQRMIKRHKKFVDGVNSENVKVVSATVTASLEPLITNKIEMETALDGIKKNVIFALSNHIRQALNEYMNPAITPARKREINTDLLGYLTLLEKTSKINVTKELIDIKNRLAGDIPLINIQDNEISDLSTAAVELENQIPKIKLSEMFANLGIEDSNIKN